MDSSSPQQSLDGTSTASSMNPPQPLPTGSGPVEVDELPQLWGYDFDSDLDHQLSSQIPTSKLALIRQRRREHYRQKGLSRPDPRLHRQRRLNCNYIAASSTKSRSQHPQSPTVDLHGAERVSQTEPEHQQSHGTSSGSRSPHPSSSASCPHEHVETDRAVPSPTACSSAKGCDGDIDMSCPDDRSVTSHDSSSLSERQSEETKPSERTTHARPRVRPSALRSESIRAALALEALKLDNESGGPSEIDGQKATQTPIASSNASYDKEFIEGLPLHREYGLLRVRPAAAAAATAATRNKVLVHSVPRVRKRRLRKLETRLAAGDSANAELSDQRPSPPAMTV